MSPNPAAAPDLVTEFGGRRVLFVMAAVPEYGTHLRRLFTPLFTGIGPVEAGVVLSATLARAAEHGRLPDLVVSLGSAGSRSLEQGAVYQADSVAYRDMDASPLGFERGVTPLIDHPVQVPLLPLVPGLETATLSTGAGVVSGAGYDTVPEQMVDMESFAALRACQLFDIPLVVLRGISDGKEELRGLSDWTDYLHVVDERLASAVVGLREALEAGTVELPGTQP